MSVVPLCRSSCCRAAAAVAAGIVVLGPVVGRRFVVGRARGLVVTDPAAVRAPIAAVLGAGLRRDGSPTVTLARRVEAAASLHRRGAVERLVMSGDAKAGRDQPRAMARLAVALGVPPDRIELDHTGVDTAATCRHLGRAHPGQRIVLVTQEFHAARTAYLAAKAGLDATVLASPDAEIPSRARLRSRLREVPASIKAIYLDRFRPAVPPPTAASRRR